jgi:hypothetical protein
MATATTTTTELPLSVLERRRDTAGEAAEATAAEMECGVILERQLANDDGTSSDDEHQQ